MKRKNVIILVLAVILLISLLTACGSNVSFKIDFIVDGDVYHTVDSKGNEEIQLPADPEKEGYIFDGWYWDNDIWEREFTANSLLDAPLSGDMSVYAKWIPEELLNEDYTVTFNSMGGSPVGSATVKYGGKINTPSAPTRKNFIFAGWYKDSDCQTVWNFNAHTVAGNITLYAKWTPEQVNPEEYTVTFVTNCDDSAAPLTVSPGSVISAPNVTNEGFSLEGWYTSLDGGSTLDEKWSFVNNKVNGNITLYAKWTAKNLFTATFNTNGGVSIASYKTSLIESSPETYKDFNTFVAWYLDSNFNESARVEFPYALTRDTTFYAKWMVESHTEGLQFTLQLASNSYFVTGYTGGASSIVVPSTYNNVQVTGINARAFEGHSGLTEVYIPNTVTNLGLGAFSECFSLKKVFIDGEGLQLIGSSVFSNCINLEQINLPDSVINIGGEAFFGCIKLKELYLSDQIKNIGTNIIRGCNSLEKLTMPGERTLISLVGDDVENIPKTLRTVAVSPGSTQIITEIFLNSAMIKEIIIPSSVTSIGANAFSGCTSLETLTAPFIGQSRTSNGFLSYYFGGTSYTRNSSLVPSSLKNIRIYGDNYTVPSYALANTGLVNIELAGVTKIESYAFSYTGIKELFIPEEINTIADFVFVGCSELEAFEVSQDNAFFKSVDGVLYSKDGSTLICCPAGKDITSYTVGDDVDNIRNSAFWGTRLNTVTLPFAGMNREASGNEAKFGVIFGSASYEEGVSVNQSGVTYVIPSALRTVNLTDTVSLGEYAFGGLSDLTSITLPENLTDIGASAFQGLSGLTQLIIPDSVENIGERAFQGSSGLTSITIPDGVTSIGSSAFSGCGGLTSIALPFVGKSISATGNGALFGYIFGMDSYTGGTKVTQYFSSGSYLTSYIPTSLSTVTVSGGELNYGAFYNCSMLTSVTIPETVTSIGDYAFYGSSGLTSITIPDVVTGIGDAAFEGCSGLTSITIPDVVTGIGDAAFEGCSGLTSVYISDIAVWCGISFSSIDSNPLYYAKNLYLNDELATDLIISDSVTSIGNYAFSGCSGLTSITIPKSVTSIGSSAFSGCGGLTSVALPFVGKSISATGSDALLGYIFGTSSFSGGTKITQFYASGYSTDYYIPSNLSSVTVSGGELNYGAFYGCSMLTSVTIPETVTSIGDYAFYGSNGLTSITIPETVASIGSGAFYGSSGLTGVYISDIAAWCGISFSSIDSNPLYYAKNLYLNDKLATDLIIPDSVTSIGNYAFSGCSGLTSITIPNSVTSIGSYAFTGCTAEIVWEEDHPITEIGGYAFGNYAGTSITIPKAVTGIGSYAFTGCTAEIVWGEDHPITEIGGYAFGNYAGTSINIPKAVTDIGSYAFTGCTAEIVWGENHPITEIGGYAFGNYKGTSINIPKAVTDIGSYAFNGCTGLTSITIPDSVTSIGSSAFYDCTGLTSITIPFVGATLNGTINTHFGYIFGAPSYSYSSYVPASLKTVVITGGASIGSYAFYDCTGLTSITIPDSVTSIGSDAFRYCRGLTSITLPFVGGTLNGTGNTYLGYLFGGSTSVPASLKTVVITGGTSIRNGTFSGCSGLTSITIPDSVTSIGSDAFRYCRGLTSITIPDSVTSIGSYAFNGCTGLTSITIPDSVTSIGSYAFSGCTGEIVWGKNPSITEIDGYVFGNYAGTRITIPDSVTSIGSSAFYNCSGLKSITIPDSVTSIGNYAFSGCSKLTSITIPDSVTSIGSDAFRYCSGLTSITLPFVGATLNGTSNTHLGYIFGASSYSSNSSYVPASLETVVITGGASIGSSAFYKCSELTSITIPDSVTSIGSSAFSGCSGLTSITIPDSVASIGLAAFSGTTWYNNQPDGLVYVGKVAYKYKGTMPANTSITLLPDTKGIADSAFSGCSGLTSITIPFIGGSKSATGSNALFGYIFGTSSYTGGTKVTQYYSSGSSASYYIPSGLRSVTVSGGELNYGAFYNCSMLTSVTIPETVTSIGERAFSGCSRLTSIHIPEALTSIGSSAFYGCSGLTSIAIPDSVTRIGSSAFSWCSGLTSVYISDIAAWCGINFSSIDSNPLYYAKNLYLNDELATDLIIPDSVTSIGSSAFYDCTGLTSITIPDSVTSIGGEAFHNTAWYNNQPDGLVYAGKVIYKYKGTMPPNTSITLLPGTKGIAGSAFEGYTGLKSITIPDSVTSIGDSAFYGCSGLTSITIPDSVTSIGSRAFSGCSWLTSMNLGSGVTSIGDSAFSNCWVLTSITIPDSVTSIGSFAFNGCSGLTSITVNNKNTVYRSEGNCLIETASNTLILGFKTSVIPETVTSIGSYAFYNCSGLKSITIPDSVTSIGSSAFFGCSGLTSITIPDSVTSIGSSAFFGCSGLTSITIPDSVTSIGSSAFQNCSGLTSVTIGNSVTSIGSGAFYACIGLTSITIPDSVTSISDYAFSDCSKLTSITIPDSVTSIGSYAFSYCSSLNSITIPNSVTSIGKSAFSGCSGLASIIFADTSTWYRTNSSYYTGGTQKDVTSPSSNATYFKSTYTSDYWYKI